MARPCEAKRDDTESEALSPWRQDCQSARASYRRTMVGNDQMVKGRCRHLQTFGEGI